MKRLLIMTYGKTEDADSIRLKQREITKNLLRDLRNVIGKRFKQKTTRLKKKLTVRLERRPKRRDLIKGLRRDSRKSLSGATQEKTYNPT